MRLVDLAGQKFGRLAVVGVVPRTKKTGGAKWLCQCECGGSTVALSSDLKSGNTTSCGCYRRQQCGDNRRTHGRSSTPLFRIWTGMITRCTNQNEPTWEYYGGRGIRVCDRWRYSFANFLADIGERPEGYSIERIDNDGNYEPNNCKWADRETQSLNKRNNVYLEVAGMRLSAHEWSKEFGLTTERIRDRLHKGWSDYDTIMTPKWGHRIVDPGNWTTR